ncbi:hypothetical protein LCGC14_2839020, partial [marine sediment metagenome]
MEIPLAKRAGDMLAALLQVIQNPKQAKEFLKDLEVSVEEFRKIELNGIELKRLKQWDAELQSREADVNGRFDEVSKIKPQAVMDAQGIVDQANLQLSLAKEQNDEAKTKIKELKDEHDIELRQLIEEHKAIKSMLSILESVCNKLESKEEINPEDLEQILDFIKTFADKYHHEKEEYLLFPAMEKAGIPREGGPIAVMLMEHNVGRDFVKRMSEAVAKYQDGIRNGSQEIIENARGYISLLTPHIE